MESDLLDILNARIDILLDTCGLEGYGDVTGKGS